MYSNNNCTESLEIMRERIEEQNIQSKDLPIQETKDTSIISVSLQGLSNDYGSEWLLIGMVGNNPPFIETIRRTINEKFEDIVILLKSITKLDDLKQYQKF